MQTVMNNRKSGGHRRVFLEERRTLEGPLNKCSLEGNESSKWWWLLPGHRQGWACCWQREGMSSFFLLNRASCNKGWQCIWSPLGASRRHLEWGFLYSVLHFPLLNKLFPQKHCWYRVRFAKFSGFVPWCQEGPFLLVISHKGRKVHCD